MKIASTPLFFVFLSAASGLAFAGTPINESRDIDASARVDISNVRGAVTVSAWDQSRVEITGTLGEGSKGLEITGGGSRLSIKVKGSDDNGWFNWGSRSRMEDTILNIRVPTSAELRVDTVSAEIIVTGTAGQLLKADSVSGKIRIDSTARELEIGSVSGSVDLSGRGERVQVETVSGDIEMRANHGRLKFETVSGNITAATGEYREFTGSSVSGDISLRGTPSGDARISAETMSGDVRMDMPGELSARIDAETFSGRIRSDFGSVKEPEHGPGRSLETTIGDGSARMTIETFSGDITIRRE
ncbi:DUF4097 family beta strand repeat-containing protein [Dokdonella sp.]|uniref:DUF4097 family beta strand repeat-containing protein n=1 Tax=Dokdonella sp. TaxID=2291710 RepID=UPI003C4E4125